MESKTLAIEYQDWRILVSPHSEGGWMFHCLPEKQETLTDDQVYATDADATRAAKRFVERIAIWMKVGGHLDKWLEEDRISAIEYTQVINLLGQMMRL